MVTDDAVENGISVQQLSSGLTTAVENRLRKPEVGDPVASPWPAIQVESPLIYGAMVH